MVCVTVRNLLWLSGVNLGAGTGEMARAGGGECTVLTRQVPLFSLFAAFSPKADAVKFRVGVGSFPEPAVPGVAGDLSSAAALTPA